MTKIRILLVDDELHLTAILQEYLEEKGFEVSTASSGENALKALKSKEIDLMLLDIRMPGMDGIEVCRSARKTQPKLPVIFVTALDTDIDKIRGLDLGADDYIAKPFNELEVAARINAVLRRSGLFDIPKIHEIGDIRIDPARREVTQKNKLVKFTPKEFDLLYYLMERQGDAVSREDLLENVWDIESKEVTTRTVDLHIRQLRKKLEKDPSEPQHIITIQRIGYKFVP